MGRRVDLPVDAARGAAAEERGGLALAVGLELGDQARVAIELGSGVEPARELSAHRDASNTDLFEIRVQLHAALDLQAAYEGIDALDEVDFLVQRQVAAELIATVQDLGVAARDGAHRFGIDLDDPDFIRLFVPSQ